MYPEAHASGSPGEAHASGSPAPAGFAFTLDGNEQFRTLEEFRQFWRKLTAAEGLWAFFEHLLFVEQPFHRDVALDPGVLAGLRDWHDRPPLIIDESDAEPDSMRRALKLGYHGTSHKNCKGIFKSILNACLLASRRRQVAGGHPEADASGSPGEADASGSPLIMSGEDLANVGPVALLQDLAAAAALGIESVERNGHHYFAGLSMFPPAVREQVLRHHGDLYRASQAGWPTLAIRDGILELGSVNRSPFGVGFDLDAGAFATVEQWRGRVP